MNVKSYLNSDVKVKVLQRVRFWSKIYALFHILKKTMPSRIYVLFRSTLYKWEFFAGFVLFKKLDYENENFIGLGFGFENHQCVRFPFEKYKEYQILK